MIDHAPDCEVLLPGGVCTCRGPRITGPHPHVKQEFGPNPTPEKILAWHRARAWTSRTVDTEPKVTWLGATKLTHPPTCAVYRSMHVNWAQDCDCYISQMQKLNIPETDPADLHVPADVLVPKEFRPAPVSPWFWALIGFGAGIVSTATALAVWPW